MSVQMHSILSAARRRIGLPLGQRKSGWDRHPRLVVYTAIFGGRDTLKAPTVLTPDARYVCFTDEPLRSDVWEVVRASITPDGPRRTSRWYKLLPHRLFQTDYSLWVDGSFRINVNVWDMIARYLRRADVGVYRHPEMDCIYELSERLIGFRVDDPDRIRRQVARYRSEGLPEHAGLVHGAILLRRHTPAVDRLNEAWWREYEQGSVRDVLGLRYCTWRVGIPLGIIDGHVLRNPELEFLGHRRQRLAEEFRQEEWARLTPPPAVSTFPSDLANTALEYGGPSRMAGLRKPRSSGCASHPLRVGSPSGG
jgi:hypothetical protein